MFLVIIFHVWFTPRSSSRNSPLRTTKRMRIISTGYRVLDTFHKRWQTKCKYSQLHMRIHQVVNTSLNTRETQAHWTQDVTTPSTPTTTPRRVGSLPQGHPVGHTGQASRQTCLQRSWIEKREQLYCWLGYLHKVKTQFPLLEFPQSSMVWTVKTPNIGTANSTNSILHNHSCVWRYDSKTMWLVFLIFHRMLVMLHRSRDGWVVGRIEVFADQFVERIFQISGCWTRRLLLLWTRSSRNSISRRWSVSRNRKPRKRIGFSADDRSLTWSTTTSRLLALMTPFLDYADLFSVLLLMTIIFRNSIQDGDEVLLSMSKKSFRWYLGKSVQIENTWVCATQNCIGIVRHGDSSEDIPIIKNWTQWWRESQESTWCWKRKNICYQWKQKGQCSQGDRCSFRYEIEDRAQKPEHTAATPSEPTVSRGRSVSKKRSIRGKGSHGSILRQPCRYYLRGTCTRTSCEFGIRPSAKSTKQKRVVNAEKSVCSRTKRLMSNQTKSQRKGLLFPHKKRKRRQECCGYCENCTTIGLRLARLGCVGSSKRKTAPVKPMKKVMGPIRKVRFTQPTLTSSKYPGKERTIAWINTSQTSTSAQSLRYEIWGEVPWRDWKTRAMCPKQSLESFQKYLHAQRKGQCYILFACGRMGAPGCVNKRAGGNRVCGGLGSVYAYGQQARP